MKLKFVLTLLVFLALVVGIFAFSVNAAIEHDIVVAIADQYAASHEEMQEIKEEVRENAKEFGYAPEIVNEIMDALDLILFECNKIETGDDLERLLKAMEERPEDVLLHYYDVCKESGIDFEGVYKSTQEILEYRYKDTLRGEYQLKPDSYYVALGHASYASELARMVGLGNKYTRYDLDEKNKPDLARADLVSVKFDNGEFLDFMLQQLTGKLAEIISNDPTLLTLYNLGFGEALGIYLNDRPAELEWSRYLDDKQQEQMHQIIDVLRSYFVSEGFPEYVDIAPMIEEQIPGIAIAGEINIPSAVLLEFAIENALYGYVQYIERVATTLYEVYTYAPGATIIVTGVEDHFAVLAEQFFGKGNQYAELVRCVELFINNQLNAIAFFDDNMVFVNSDSPYTIIQKLNLAKCNHIYSDCTDTDCNLCGYVRYAPGHSFVEYVYNNDATCIQDGTEETVCYNCGARNVRTVPYSALGHSYTNYVYNNDATCTQNGTKTSKCDRCEERDTKTVWYSALGHSFTNYVSDGNATCTENGTATAKCDRCSSTDTMVLVDTVLGHSFTNYVSNGDATCTENGTETAKCDRCILKYTRIDEDSALGHVFVGDVCTDLMTCSACGVEGEQILGHSFINYISDENATCTENATETAKCDRCEETDTRIKENSALGHSFGNPTCVNSAKCSVCGAEGDEALGHSFMNYVSDDNATCTENATETAKCDRCEETDTRVVENSALGHSFGNWTVAKKPTLREEGINERRCLSCDARESAPIEKKVISPVATVFIILGSVAVLVGSGAAVYYFLVGKKKAIASKPEATSEEE